MRDLGKLIVAKGFKKMPKMQKIAQSGHTDHITPGAAGMSPFDSIILAHIKHSSWDQYHQTILP